MQEQQYNNRADQRHPAARKERFGHPFNRARLSAASSSRVSLHAGIILRLHTLRAAPALPGLSVPSRLPIRPRPCASASSLWFGIACEALRHLQLYHHPPATTASQPSPPARPEARKGSAHQKAAVEAWPPRDYTAVTIDTSSCHGCAIGRHGPSQLPAGEVPWAVP